MDTRIDSFDKLRINFEESILESTRQSLHNVCATNVPEWAGESFSGIFEQLLKGIGLPCPGLMDTIRGRFSELVILENSSDSFFRMKMFCLAASGSPQILLEGGPIKVSSWALLNLFKLVNLSQIILVEDQDQLYLPSTILPGTRLDILAKGTCSFKTCSRTMRVPVSHLLKLLQASYVEDREPRNAKAAVFHWLLSEILDGVGDYTTVWTDATTTPLPSFYLSRRYYSTHLNMDIKQVNRSIPNTKYMTSDISEDGSYLSLGCRCSYRYVYELNELKHQIWRSRLESLVKEVPLPTATRRRPYRNSFIYLTSYAAFEGLKVLVN